MPRNQLYKQAMPATLKQKNWSNVTRRALTATEVVASLANLQGWTLTGDGHAVAIERTFTFVNYYQTISFVNAVAFIAHVQDHHPDLMVHFSQCVVRFTTHDVQGISVTDIDCAAQIDALLLADN